MSKPVPSMSSSYTSRRLACRFSSALLRPLVAAKHSHNNCLSSASMAATLANGININLTFYFYKIYYICVQ